MALSAHPDHASELTHEHTQQLIVLEKSTDSFLEVLDSWRVSSTSNSRAGSSSVIATRRHVGDFVEAYDKGFKAAELGHTFAQEGIDLAESNQQNANDPDSVQAYLQKMRKTAFDGKQNANDAMSTFRDVRKRIAEAIRMKNSNLEQDDRNLLQKQIPVLENFEQWMNNFIQWWTDVDMQQNQQNTYALERMNSSNAQIMTLGALRTWKILKAGYLGYTEKMKRVQDKYRDVFDFARASAKLLREDEEHDGGTQVEGTQSSTSGDGDAPQSVDLVNGGIKAKNEKTDTVGEYEIQKEEGKADVLQRRVGAARANDSKGGPGNKKKGEKKKTSEVNEESKLNQPNPADAAASKGGVAERTPLQASENSNRPNVTNQVNAAQEDEACGCCGCCCDWCRRCVIM